MLRVHGQRALLLTAVLSMVAAAVLVSAEPITPALLQKLGASRHTTSRSCAAGGDPELSRARAVLCAAGIAEFSEGLASSGIRTTHDLGERLTVAGMRQLGITLG